MQTNIFQQIEEKYKEKYYKLSDIPPVGTKVVYFPAYDGMIYALYDGAYEQYHFHPGDIMTIKRTKKDDIEVNTVYVQENDCVFTPAELVPVQYVDETDRKKVQEEFQRKLQEKIERENNDTPNTSFPE